MKEKLIKIAKISLWVLAGVSLLVTLVAAINKDNNTLCKDVTIQVNYESGNNFIDEKDIDSIVKMDFENQLIGQKLRLINFNKIETRLKKDPYVRNAEVFSNMNEQLVIQVEQKHPLLRIINNTGVSYYLSDKGDSIPLSSKFTPRVLVATGFISNAETEQLKKLAEFISQDKFWNAAVEQVYVNDRKDFELYTKLGEQNVVIGKVDDELQEKFKKLRILYTEGLPNVGWNQYKTINLKFKNQVICTKI